MEDLIAQVRAQMEALVGLPTGRQLPNPPPPPASDTPIASYIDHTLLKPEATSDQIDRLCNEAERYRFASVCVNPRYVERCARVGRVAGAGLYGYRLSPRRNYDES